jgi:hypothetical protein
MTRARPRLPLIAAGRPAPPTKTDWLQSEFLKTRVARLLLPAPGTSPSTPAPTPTFANNGLSI